MRLPNYYEDLNVLHVGTLPARTHYAPKGAKTLLNGVWDFAYYGNPDLVPEGFVQPAFDASGFDRLPVPSCWQVHGYDRNMYVNADFPFPLDPPYMPHENPCGAYRTWFDVPEDNLVRHLTFEGVDSCLFVWVNGSFVGYGQVSHSSNEFDVTPYVKPGKNLLAVLVLKWCDGSYLEDQDKLRMSGIFRDVYLLARPRDHVRDFAVTTPVDESGAAVCVALDVTGDAVPTVTLLDGEAVVASASGTQVRLPVRAPKLWNAETPYLYTLRIQTPGETIEKRVGIRTVCIENKVLKINGKKVKLRGTNHHDSSPFNGYAMTREEILTDLRLMKAHNFNAIRTSHYPPQAQMVELCDELGFYLIDESDVECHGITRVVGTTQPQKYNLMADDPRWEKAIVDRVAHCVLRDRNAPSVIIWSLGNESGYGGCFEAAAKWVKATDPTRLLHYEGANNANNGHPYEPEEKDLFWDGHHAYPRPDKQFDQSLLDMHSRMYPPLSWIRQYLADPANDKPLVLCEYTHAMGNGPGDAEDYYRLVLDNDAFMGAFVWEWCDHSVYMGRTPDGRSQFFYGGDWGEWPHDGNFCMDGLVYPDRRVSNSLRELKNVYRPVRLMSFDAQTGQAVFKNLLDFTDLSGFAQVRYAVRRNGQTVRQGVLDGLCAAPGQTASACIGPVEALPRTTVLFTYVQTCDLPMTKAGHELGFDQAVVETPPVPAPQPVQGPAPQLETTDTAFTVSGPAFRYRFNRRTGGFDELCYHNEAILRAPMRWNIWRAPTDNDRNIKLQWMRSGYDKAVTRVYQSDAAVQDGKAVITAVFGLTAPVVQRIATVQVRFEIDPAGQIALRANVRRTPAMPFLPRFGLRLFLDPAYNAAEYYGYGPYESYLDKRRASYLDRFTQTVEQMHEDYLRPQENGSHYGCGFVRLTAPGRVALTADGPQGLSFNASRYTQEELTRKAHNFELEKSPYTVLCLDYRQSGIGSNSCGPALAEALQLPETFTMEMTLRFD